MESVTMWLPEAVTLEVFFTWLHDFFQELNIPPPAFPDLTVNELYLPAAIWSQIPFFDRFPPVYHKACDSVSNSDSSSNNNSLMAKCYFRERPIRLVVKQPRPPPATEQERIQRQIEELHQLDMANTPRPLKRRQLGCDDDMEVDTMDVAKRSRFF